MSGTLPDLELMPDSVLRTCDIFTQAAHEMEEKLPKRALEHKMERHSRTPRHEVFAQVGSSYRSNATTKRKGEPSKPVSKRPGTSAILDSVLVYAENNKRKPDVTKYPVHHQTQAESLAKLPVPFHLGIFPSRKTSGIIAGASSYSISFVASAAS